PPAASARPSRAPSPAAAPVSSSSPGGPTGCRRSPGNWAGATRPTSSPSTSRGRTRARRWRWSSAGVVWRWTFSSTTPASASPVALTSCRGSGSSRWLTSTRAPWCGGWRGNYSARGGKIVRKTGIIGAYPQGLGVDSPLGCGRTERQIMEAAHKKEERKSVFSDYDYSNFYYGAGDDPVNLLGPFRDWWQEARPNGYYLYSEPLSSAPATHVRVRNGKTGGVHDLLNLASYNYLGISYRDEV